VAGARKTVRRAKRRQRRAARKVGRSTRKVARKVARGTRRVARKVARATRPYRAPRSTYEHKVIKRAAVKINEATAAMEQGANQRRYGRDDRG